MKYKAKHLDHFWFRGDEQA